MSAARARRRLMAHERYRRRALLLGAHSTLPAEQLHAADKANAHEAAVLAVHRRQNHVWLLPDPYEPP